MAITQDRFRVYDSPLNLVRGFRRKDAALRVARRYAQRGGYAVVEDRLARRGHPNKWTPNGVAIGWKA